MSVEARQKCYESYLEEAFKLARKLQKQNPSTDHVLDGTLGELQFFALPECCINSNTSKRKKGLLGKLKSILSN